MVRSSGFMDGGYQADQHEEQTFILGDGDVIAGKNNELGASLPKRMSDVSTHKPRSRIGVL